MKSLGVWLIGVGLAIACAGESVPASGNRLAAEGFLKGVYACDKSGLDTLAAEDIVISYPVFESIFGTSAIRGRTNVAEFADRFCSRWSDPEITIHEVVEEGDRVVMVWEFAATGADEDSAGAASGPVRQSWGGISFLRFDTSGKVIEELGEESTPGPMARLREGS